MKKVFLLGWLIAILGSAVSLADNCADRVSLLGLGLQDKTVVVTGGSRGIGRKIVERFAAAGANILFTYESSVNQADDVVNSLEANGHKVRAFRVDVRDAQSCTKFVDSVAADYGKIDVLINNAGITRDGLLLTLSEENWDAVLDCNLGGCFHMTKPVAEIMVRNRSGAIINLSSVVAAIPNRGQANYAASKGAIESLTRALAQELGKKNIRVNAVAPGYIETEMTATLPEKVREEAASRPALRRMGSPNDVANAVLFLASDLATYITGAVVPVDGGYQ